MKFLLPTLALVAATSLPALAQEAPPAGAMPPPPASDVALRPTTEQMAAMQKVREQMRQLHETTRLQVLGSLSAAHRAALANIIGQYAIAPHPDERATVAQIDAMLSAGEKQSVINAETASRANGRALMESVRAQFEASASPDERAKMEARDAKRAQFEQQRAASGRPQMTADAGRTLLHLAVSGAGPGPGPQGPGGREFGGPGRNFRPQ